MQKSIIHEHWSKNYRKLGNRYMSFKVMINVWERAVFNTNRDEL
jgi:hypothetical protein